MHCELAMPAFPSLQTNVPDTDKSSTVSWLSFNFQYNYISTFTF